MFFVHPQIRFRHIIRAKLAFARNVNSSKLFAKLSFYFPGKQFVFTDMGRTAFRLAVKHLGLANTEILMPAYICDIFGPILQQYNIKPIFLDIDLKTFNIKIEEIEKKSTPQTKAILVSHTYGLPNDMEKILALAKKYNLKVIEDCAHTFGAKYRGKYVGNFGEAAFFSLYKQLPVLRGGLLVLPQYAGLTNYARAQKLNLDLPRTLPKTRFNFRDLISFLNYFSPCAWFFKRFGGAVAPKMLRKEKLVGPAGLNRVSINLFSSFLQDFERTLEKRKELARFFQEELRKLDFEVQELENNVFCFLSALLPKNLQDRRDNLVKQLRKYGIFATRIWHSPIAPDPDEFPNTFEASKRIINFPLQNFYNKKDIEKMIQKIKKVKKLIEE